MRLRARGLAALVIVAALATAAGGADLIYTGIASNPQRQLDMGDTTWAVVVVPQGHPNRFTASLINSAATTLTEIKATPGAGLSLYITDIVASSSAAATATTDQQLTLKYGTGTNCGTGTTAIWSYFNAATAGVAQPLVIPFKLPANNALCFIHAAAGSKSVTANGYIAP